MKWLVELANQVHNMLAPLIGAGLHPSQAMSGALAVVNAAGDHVLFQATANYNPARGHVEPQLMAALFDWTRKNGTPFILPPGCSVCLYVFNSPCKECAAALAKSRWAWGRNPTVKWYLGFTRYYLAGANSYADPPAANRDYNGIGWPYSVINAAAAAPPAAPPAAAAAAAAGGGGGGAAAAVPAAAPAHVAAGPPAKRARHAV